MTGKEIDRNLALEAVRVTETAALAAARLIGSGDEIAADRVAAGAMHDALDSLSIRGRVVIGEGEPESAPLLYTGEIVGCGDGPDIDLALDPLEGATICARGGQNACSVIALARKGGFLSVPDVYMDKIAIGPGFPPGLIDLDSAPQTNLKALAKAKGVSISDLLVCVLDRPRHADLIARIREAGARVMLINDGDLSGIVACGQPHSGVDMYLGVGGACEGVLAAAALFCLGGQMQGRLLPRGETERQKMLAHGLDDFSRKYHISDLVHGDVMFAVTGVTDGAMLRGVRRWQGGAVTHSLVIRSASGTVRHIEALHNTLRKGTEEARG